MHSALLNQINHELLSPQNVSISNLSDHNLDLIITLPFVYKTKQQLLTQYLIELFNQFKVSIEFKTLIIPHKVKPGLVRISNIKNIIAVTSGKGGVGKSTTAINLALGLANNGANVGILDADIYGPSLPILVGERDFKPEVENTCFVPLYKYGLKIMSFGFLVAETQPAIWRGAVVNKALEQMLFDSVWGELDYLVIDMPPGTGDIHLTMCQKMPITAVITVTTPQDIALLDVGKSVAMYNKMEIPCLGIIENMSTHTCSNCGHVEAVFGSNGGSKLAENFNLELLAQLPLDIDIRKSSDNGIPVTYKKAENPLDHHKLGLIYDDLAVTVSQKISMLGKDFSSKLGKINIIKN